MSPPSSWWREQDGSISVRCAYLRCKKISTFPRNMITSAGNVYVNCCGRVRKMSLVGFR